MKNSTKLVKNPSPKNCTTITSRAVLHSPPSASTVSLKGSITSTVCKWISKWLNLDDAASPKNNPHKDKQKGRNAITSTKKTSMKHKKKQAPMQARQIEWWTNCGLLVAISCNVPDISDKNLKSMPYKKKLKTLLDELTPKELGLAFQAVCVATSIDMRSINVK